MKKKFFLNTVLSVAMQLISLICGFILPRLILEHYGSEVNGLTQSIKQFLGIISFLELGIGQVIQSALYKPLADRDNAAISKILVSGQKFFLRIARVLFVYVVVLAVAYPFISHQSFDWLYTAVLIIAISLHSFAQYLFGITDNLLLNADQRGYIQYISQIGAVLLNTVVSVLAINAGCSIQTVKLLSAFVFVLRPCLVRLYVRRQYQIDRTISYTGEPIEQKWNGIAQHVSAVVLEGTDTIVLTLFASLSDVSIYSVYFMVIGGVKQFYQAATAGIQSAVGALWAKQEMKTLHQVFSAMEAALHLITVFLFSCVGILIVPFVSVYTDGLADADYIQPAFAAVLTLAYWIRCIRTPYNIMILAGGHYKQTQRCHILAAVLNVVISVAAVWQWGLIGIAVGTLVALLYQTVWMIGYNTKNLLKWPLKNTLKQICVDALTFGAIYLATDWIPMTQVSYWGWFLMALQVGLIALAITAMILWIFYRSQLLSVVSWYRKKRGR